MMKKVKLATSGNVPKQNSNSSSQEQLSLLLLIILPKYRRLLYFLRLKHFLPFNVGFFHLESSLLLKTVYRVVMVQRRMRDSRRPMGNEVSLCR